MSGDVPSGTFIASLNAELKAGERRGFDTSRELPVLFTPSRLFVNIAQPGLVFLRVVLVGNVNVLDLPHVGKTVDAWLFSDKNPQSKQVELPWPPKPTRHLRAIGYISKKLPEGYSAGMLYTLALDFVGIG